MANKQQDGQQLKRSLTDRIIDFIEPKLEYVKSTEGEHYIAFKDKSPHHVIPVGTEAIDAVTNLWFASTSSWPGSDAQRQVLQYISSKCRMQAPSPVYMRSAQVDGSLYLDTGWQTGEVIRINRTGWEVLPASPVRFVRGSVCASLPDPQDVQGDISLLSKYIRVDRDWLPVLVGVIIASWSTLLPQPIILFKGGAASGKSTAMRFLLDLVDPTEGQPGAQLTDDPRDLKALASVRRPLVFDNVSNVTAKQSDLLAKISTGGEIISRRLYTDNQAHITQLIRPVVLNGIFDGFSRGDLASRTFSFELPDFESGQRSAATGLAAQWKLDRAAIFRGLLDLAVAVLAKQAAEPVMQTDFHRNADVINIIRIVSEAIGGDGIAAVKSNVADLAQSVLDSSPVGSALRQLIEGEDQRPIDASAKPYMAARPNQFTGIEWGIEQLRFHCASVLGPELARTLPSTARGFGEAIKRCTTELRAVHGIDTERKRTNSGYTYRFTRNCNDRD